MGISFSRFGGDSTSTERIRKWHGKHRGMMLRNWRFSVYVMGAFPLILLVCSRTSCCGLSSYEMYIGCPREVCEKVTDAAFRLEIGRTACAKYSSQYSDW